MRSGYSVTWIEQAGITTQFTTPLFPFIQTLGQQTLDNINPAFYLSQGPTVTLQPPGADAGLGQGVFGVQRDNGSGYAQQWNFSLQKTVGANWSVEAGYLGSKLTRLGVPDVNLNQLTREQLASGALLTLQRHQHAASWEPKRQFRQCGLRLDHYSPGSACVRVRPEATLLR